METYSSDDETAEAVKKWWRENGKSVIGGAVLGLSAVFGWQWWQANVTQQGIEAAAIYDRMFNTLATDPAAARVEADTLTGQYPSTPYAALAELAIAKTMVEQGAGEEAAVHLRKAIELAKLPELVEVARLRLARLLADGGKHDEALAELARVQGFTASGEEVRGDIHLARGERDEAKAAYQRALDAGGNRSTLSIKLDDLGG